MGITTAIAINEGVSLLEKLSPARLEQLRRQFPLLSDELSLGIYAGANEEQQGAESSDALMNEKASIMIAALAEAWKAAEKALMSVSRRVRTARRWRLVSQAVVIVGSSSSLAALGLSKSREAVVAAVLTLFAALGNLAAEYQEKLLSPQAGNIYDVFQKLGEGAYKARTLSRELSLALKYREGGSELKSLVASANVLCEQLNGWLIQLLSKIPRPKQVDNQQSLAEP